MMDKIKRGEMLARLDKGEITVPQAVEQYGVTERHVRRLLSAMRKGPRPVHEKPFAEASTKPDLATPPTPTTSQDGPTAAEIDAALAGESGGSSSESMESGVDPDEITADMAISAAESIKMLLVCWAADAMEVPQKYEGKVAKLCQLSPLVKTVIKKQKPETLAGVGKLAESPWAIPVSIGVELLVAGIALYKLAPVKEEKGGE